MTKATRKDTNKAKSSGHKRPLNAIARLELVLISSEAKAELVQKLTALQTEDVIKKKHILVGSNTVAKALEASNVAVLVVPRDSPASVVNHLVESAVWKKVHVVVVPKFVMELRDILKLRSASCFAIPSKAITATALPDMEEEMISSRVDAFKDFLLAS